MQYFSEERKSIHPMGSSELELSLDDLKALEEMVLGEESLLQFKGTKTTENNDNIIHPNQDDIDSRVNKLLVRMNKDLLDDTRDNVDAFTSSSTLEGPKDIKTSSRPSENRRRVTKRLQRSKEVLQTGKALLSSETQIARMSASTPRLRDQETMTVQPPQKVLHEYEKKSPELVPFSTTDVHHDPVDVWEPICRTNIYGDEKEGDEEFILSSEPSYLMLESLQSWELL